LEKEGEEDSISINLKGKFMKRVSIVKYRRMSIIRDTLIKAKELGFIKKTLKNKGTSAWT
jgi:hypothetical protein